VWWRRLQRLSAARVGAGGRERFVVQSVKKLRQISMIGEWK
jgi:hypothetical protein